MKQISGFILLVLLVLSGCGQKGDLYLPTVETEKNQVQKKKDAS